MSTIATFPEFTSARNTRLPSSDTAALENKRIPPVAGDVKGIRVAALATSRNMYELPDPSSVTIAFALFGKNAAADG